MAYYHQEKVDEEAQIKRLRDLAKRCKKFQEELGRYKEKQKTTNRLVGKGKTKWKW